jgi:hypothetical protein
MVDVILERQFDPHLSFDDFTAMARASADCLPLYRAQWMESFLASDGHSLTCRFKAPDTESVRMIVRDVPSRAQVAWAGTVHDTGRDGEATAMVERRFEEPVTVEALQDLENASAWCLEQHQVTFLRTFFSADCRRMICVYHAPDAESVRLAQRQAKMPVERVWPCRRYSTADFGG